MKSRWWRTRTAKLVSAGLLLAALYFAADWRSVGRVLATLDVRYLSAALVLFIPQTLLSAWRWRMLMTPLRRFSLTEAVRHTAIASAWNLILPSKLGDLSKAGLVQELSPSQRAAAGGLVVLEKIADVAALCALILLGSCAAQSLGTMAIAAIAAPALDATARGSLWNKLRNLQATPRQLTTLTFATLLLWTLHVWQIELFMRSAGVFVPWQMAAARLPLAIFAGLLPLSFCGVGTRDAALVWLFADVAPASAMAAVGLLTALRYLLPGAFGIAVLAGGRDGASR